MLWQVEPSGNCRKVSENNLFTSGEVSRYLQLTSCGLAESINRDSARYFIYGIGILILVILGYLNTLFWVTNALKRLSKAGNLFHSGYKTRERGFFYEFKSCIPRFTDKKVSQLLVPNQMLNWGSQIGGFLHASLTECSN